MGSIRLYFFLLCVLSFSASANLRFERWGIDDGLSQNSVRSTVKDQQGFMWFSTDDGLNRFDGYEFRIFRPQPNNDQSLSSNDVSSLYVDNAGVLWVGTWGNGFNRYDAKTEQFERFVHNELDSNSLSHEKVWKIIGDDKQGLWIATANGLNYFNTVTKNFKRYFHQVNNQTSLSHNDVRDVHIDKLGRIWVATFGGLNLFLPQSDTFQRFNQGDGEHQIISDYVTVIESDDTHLWVGTNDAGLTAIEFDSMSKESQHWKVSYFQHQADNARSLGSNTIFDLLVDEKGQLWVAGTGLGLCQLRNDSEFDCYKHNPSNLNSISRNDIWHLYEDDSQRVWVGTQSGGVNRVDLGTGGFKQVYNPDGKASGLSDNTVWGFVEGDDGALWVGTERGVNRIKDGKVTVFRHDAQDDSSLSHDYIHKMAMHKGVLWVGTHDGFNKMNMSEGTFERIKFNGVNQLATSAYDITQIKPIDNDRMWLGTYGSGLFYFDINSRQAIHYRHVTNNNNSLSDDYIVNITIDKQKNLWISTMNGGLNYYEVNKRKFTHYRYKKDDNTSISSDYVTATLLHSDGSLWAGTNSGLNRMNIDTGQFERYKLGNGSTNNIIRGLIEDDKGNLWISNNMGLSNLDFKNDRIIHYDAHDGLQSNEFKHFSYYKSPNGTMYFGGVKGYNYFRSEDIVIDNTPPKIVFTDLLISNQSVPIATDAVSAAHTFTLPVAINFLPNLQLDYRHNLVSVEFAGLHFTNPLKNQYAYRLVGLNDEWIYTDVNNRRATYSNLPAGDYVLEVKASNRDGIWTQHSKELTITVLPPPWRTWWAYTLYFCLGMLPVFIYMRAQRREIFYKYEQNIKLEQTVAKRTEELEKRNQQIEQKNSEIIDAQHQIVQSEKMASLGTLTAGVAHEVNNPNNFVYVSAQNLLEDVEKAQAFFMELAGENLDEDLKQAFDQQFAPIRENVATIKDGSKRIQTIVKDLRTFTQLDNAERNEVVLTDLVTATVNLAKSKYLNLVTFDCQFAETPVMLCYPAQLNQVFMNLIVNACHAIEEKINQHLLKHETEHKGCITIMAYVVREQAVIEFIDNGIGFDEQVKQKLCEPFYTTKTVGKGTGLGLSISYGIIQKHNGRLLISSTPGVGSSFKVVLPLRN